MKKYQCINCKQIATSEEWNKATNEEYENNIAALPKDFISVPGVDTIEKMNDRVEDKDYYSNGSLPAFVCPHCGFAPMANELIEIEEER